MPKHMVGVCVVHVDAWPLACPVVVVNVIIVSSGIKNSNSPDLDTGVSWICRNDTVLFVTHVFKCVGDDDAKSPPS